MIFASQIGDPGRVGSWVKVYSGSAKRHVTTDHTTGQYPPQSTHMTN